MSGLTPDDKCALQIIKLATEQAERIRLLESDNLNYRVEIRSYLFDRRVPISIRESSKKLLSLH